MSLSLALQRRSGELIEAGAVDLSLEEKPALEGWPLWPDRASDEEIGRKTKPDDGQFT
jgi:hypothetical protein